MQQLNTTRTRIVGYIAIVLIIATGLYLQVSSIGLLRTAFDLLGWILACTVASILMRLAGFHRDR